MTVGEWLRDWYDLYIEPEPLAPNTKAMYNRAVRAVADPLISIQLQDLTALDVRRWLLSVAAVTPRAAQLDRMMLQRALRIAGKLGFCRRDLIDDETCPQIRHEAAKAEVLDAAQLKAYMHEACRLGGPAERGLILCACGLRRGEARGVTWADVDFDVGTVAITGQRQRMGPKIPCKTARSARRLSLPECVLEALRGAREAPLNWVAPCCERRLYEAHRALLERLGLPGGVTLHGLRHSLATAAAMGGTPMKQLQGYLGHASYKITADIYADHLPSVVDFPVLYA